MSPLFFHYLLPRCSGQSLPTTAPLKKNNQTRLKVSSVEIRSCTEKQTIYLFPQSEKANKGTRGYQSRVDTHPA